MIFKHVVQTASLTDSSTDNGGGDLKDVRACAVATNCKKKKNRISFLSTAGGDSPARVISIG